MIFRNYGRIHRAAFIYMLTPPIHQAACIYMLTPPTTCENIGPHTQHRKRRATSCI